MASSLFQSRFNMWKRIVTCLLATALITVSTGNLHAAEIIDRIVAIVNGDIITLSELEKASRTFYENMKAQAMKTGQELPPLTELRKQVLNFLIDKKLTEQESQRLGITVTEQDIDNAINNLLKDKGISRMELMEGLKKEGKTLDDFREEIKQNIQRARLINQAVKSKIVVTDEEVEKFYEEHKDQFSQKEKWHLKVIYLPYPVNPTEKDKQEVLKMAKKLRQQIDEGTSFEALARKYSQGPGAKEGGDVGYLNPDDLDPHLAKFVSQLPEGGVSQPVETEDGIYLFKVEEKQEGGSKSYENAKNYIRRLLYQREVNKRYMEWLQELRKKSYIKINL